MSEPFPARTVIVSFNLIERMMSDIVGVVPFCPEHHGVWSPQLATVLLEAGSQLDSLWKARSPAGPRPDMPAYFSQFGEGVARSWLVFWGEGGHRVQPFAAWDGAASWAKTDYVPLPWWRAYNAVKHDRLAERRQATLMNAVEALAALFVAIVRSPPCASAVANEEWIPDPSRYGQTPEELLAGGGFIGNLVAESRLFSFPFHAGAERPVSVPTSAYSPRFAHWCGENGIREW